MLSTFFTLDVVFFLILLSAQKPTPTPDFAGCIENSPERQGKIGCTIIEDKVLPAPLSEPVYWYIDRFDSIDAARAAVGPTSVAMEAHGAAWLVTVQKEAPDYGKAKRVARVGPLPLPVNGPYSIQVMSALFEPGVVSRVHTHPGPEAFYLVDGAQCLETPMHGQRTIAGESYIVPAGVPMRVSATPNAVRRALALILHPVGHSAIHVITDPPQLVPCK